MFDLRMVGYFVAAYEEGSITGAAKRCYIAQPSISTAILKLESILESQLFKRTKKGLSPTSEGEKFYRRAKNLLAESEAILKDFRQTPPRELKMHLQDDLLIQRIAPLINGLYKHIPGMILRLTRAEEECDIKLISDHCKKEKDFFISLWEEDYVVMIPSNHPLRFKTTFELKDLHQAPFIERPYCVMAQVFADLLVKQNIVPDVRARVASEEALLRLVELGIGITLAPESHSKEVKDVVIRPLHDLPGIKRRVGLACAAGDTESIKLIHLLKKSF